MNKFDTSIPQISECTVPSPVQFAGRDPSATIRYRQDSEGVCLDPCMSFDPENESVTFERAGPRERLVGNPSKMTAAIMTCGGLCPGLNDVIRGLVMSLSHHYGVQKILGIQYGYTGLVPGGHPPAVRIVFIAPAWPIRPFTQPWRVKRV